MRWGVFGDVHGNLQGLEAVLAALAGEGCDALLCLGDVVGYGADPAACCARLRDAGIPCLLGNHDQAMLAGSDLSWFNDHARVALEWTRHQLAPDEVAWLSGLEPTTCDEGFVAVHSSLPDPWRWDYVLTPAAAAATLSWAEENIVLVGHTHMAEGYGAGSGVRLARWSLPDGGELELAPGGRYVLNPGSCGQPRDRRWQASYGVLDLTARRFVVRRVPYEVGAAADRILWAGLPARLAARLFEGR
jgi:predicted phosphodiesterase